MKNTSISKLYDWIIIIVTHLFLGSIFGILWNYSLAPLGLPSLNWTQSFCLWSMMLLLTVVSFTVCYSIHKVNQELTATRQNEAMLKLINFSKEPSKPSSAEENNF